MYINSFSVLNYANPFSTVHFIPTPICQRTSRILLFDHGSFAKFLELKFYTKTYGTRYQGDQNSVCVLTLSTRTMYNTSYTRQTDTFHTHTHTHTHTGRTRLTCHSWMYSFHLTSRRIKQVQRMCENIKCSANCMCVCSIQLLYMCMYSFPVHIMI